MKICIVSISLAKGGAERSTAILSKMLESEGYEVYLVLLNNSIDYEFAGSIFNLGFDKKVTGTPWKRFKRIAKLRHFLKAKRFEYIIDTRSRQSAMIEWMYINYVYQDFKFIYLVHNANIQKYLTEYSWIAKLIVKKAYKIVGVSNHITDMINFQYNTLKSIKIYNSFDVPKEKNNEIVNNERYILFLGRFDDHHKNILLLVESYRLSQLSEYSVQLYLVGDGQDKEMIQQKINSLELQRNIKIFHFTQTIYPILKNALFLVLTSNYEGFPMVLIEALSVGTPVISVDCQSGPSEIIQHEQNGLLVENHNPKEMAKAFNRFLLDEKLYDFCKKNSIQSVSHLNQKTIAKQWSLILNP